MIQPRSLSKIIDANLLSNNLNSFMLSNKLVFDDEESLELPDLGDIYEKVQLVNQLGIRNILIIGETGVGKEQIAKLLHNDKLTKQKFVAVNCAGIPTTLAENLLFGHTRDAFTGSVKDKVGLIEHAHEGTLFLDEIQELSSDIQAKLLRAIQTRQVCKVGSLTPTKVLDFKLVCASNHIDIGKFNKLRPDLFARISEFIFEIPPIRQRPNDILTLINHYNGFYASKSGYFSKAPVISEDALKYLRCCEWKTNIRGLRNAIQQAQIQLIHDLTSNIFSYDRLHQCAKIDGSYLYLDLPRGSRVYKSGPGTSSHRFYLTDQLLCELHKNGLRKTLVFLLSKEGILPRLNKAHFVGQSR